MRMCAKQLTSCSITRARRRCFARLSVSRAFLGETHTQWHQGRGGGCRDHTVEFPTGDLHGVLWRGPLVTGNPVVVKPAEQTPAIARRMCELFWQAGVPREVLALPCGSGRNRRRAYGRA